MACVSPSMCTRGLLPYWVDRNGRRNRHSVREYVPMLKHSTFSISQGGMSAPQNGGLGHGFAT